MVATSERMLHVVYSVGSLERTGLFLKALGMDLLRARDVPSEKYTNEVCGFGTESLGAHFSLELTYNYGVESYEVGSGLGAFILACDDPVAVAGRMASAGFEQKPVLGGKFNSSRILSG